MEHDIFEGRQWPDGIGLEPDGAMPDEAVAVTVVAGEMML